MLWSDLFSAIALLLILEGLLPFANPEGARRTFSLLSQMDSGSLRYAGLAAIIAGLAVLYLVRMR